MAKILVIDNDPKIVGIFKELLMENQFEVLTATGGQEGLELISSGEKIDLLILDLGMPQVNGSDILMKMLNLKIAIPTLIITGSLNIEKYSYAIVSAGIPPENILFKPLDLYELLQKIKSLLRIP